MREAAAAPAAKRSHHAKPKPPKPDSKTQLMTSFFQKPPPPPQPGRPAGLPPKKRGRPAASATSSTDSPQPAPAVPERATEESSEKKLGKRAAATMIGAKLKRINWGHGEPLEHLTKAVQHWDAKSGLHLATEPAMPLTRYAEMVEIHYQTLSDYCCKDLTKRKQLGKSVGSQPIFTADEQQFAVDVVRHHDRGNDGLNKRQCVDVLHELKPTIKRASVAQTFDRTVRKNHTAVLTGIVKANPTTVKRTAIIVAQQYRWHIWQSTRRMISCARTIQVCCCPLAAAHLLLPTCYCPPTTAHLLLPLPHTSQV